MLSPAALLSSSVPKPLRASPQAVVGPSLLRRLRALRDASADESEMLLDGPHLLYEALSSNTSLSALWYTAAAQRREGPRLERALRIVARAGLEATEVSDAVMARLSPSKTPAGVVALARRPRWEEASVLMREAPFLLVGCDVQDPGNVGALVRVAEAAGATGVWLTASSADPFSWRALRGSMGSAFRLPIVRSASAREVVAHCRARDISVLAADGSAERDMYDADFRGALAILVGAEGAGIPAPVLRACSGAVRIPMATPVESLNVATAAALLAYEVRRQRTKNTPRPS